MQNNRIIKFRAWDAERMLMLYECERAKPLQFYMDRIKANNNGSCLMQYVGLNDRNGNEIYEGDLLKVHAGNEQNKSKVWEVVFYEGAFCLKRSDWDHKPTAFITYSDQCFNNGLDVDCTSQIEVIGNKFENSIILSNAN